MRSRPTVMLIAAAVLAGSLVACTTPSDTDEPSAEPISIQDIEIEGVRASQPDRWAGDGSNWEVTLTWEAPDAEIDHYVVTRDDIQLANAVVDLTYTDAGVVPDERIRYEVVGIAANDTSSRPGRVSLRTGQPSLSDARFDGTFNVDMVATEWTSPIVKPQSYPAQFIFKALCPKSEWSCDVSWDEFYGTAEGTLKRKGSTFAGAATGTLNLPDCRTGKKLDAHLDIDVTVLGAAGDDGWLVDDFRGTIVESLPASVGCPAVSITWRFSL